MTPAPKKDKAPVGRAEPKREVSQEARGEGATQDRFDEAQEQGYFGTVTDPTPNENYTLKGVGEGKPTPETDSELQLEARARVHTDARRL